jgi:hypothetical protein
VLVVDDAPHPHPSKHADDPLATGAPSACSWRAVVGLTENDPFASAALYVVQWLAEHGKTRETVILDASIPPSAAGRLADGHDAALVVVPAPKAKTPERSAYRDRACKIAMATRHPLLFVPPSAPWPPKRCVLAVDFGRGSIDAALTALILLEPPAVAAPAFVDTGEGLAPSGPDGVPPHHLRLLFDALPSALGPHENIGFAPHLLKGQRLSALLSFAEAYEADLIAIGRQGRWDSVGQHPAHLGPTAAGLVEHAPCSLLVSSST